MNSSSNSMEVKVCIIGDTDVGKTSLSTRYCHNEFPNNSTPTIGASFMQKRLQVEGTEVSLQIWDTAGQERFRSMAPMYYRGAKGAICCYDLTNSSSLNHLTNWIKDLKMHADLNCVIILVGNKYDKLKEYDNQKDMERENEVKIQSLLKSLSSNENDSSEILFFKASALTGENVDEIFESLSKKVVEVYRGNLKKEENLKLGQQKEAVAASSCC